MQTAMSLGVGFNQFIVKQDRMSRIMVMIRVTFLFIPRSQKESNELILLTGQSSMTQVEVMSAPVQQLAAAGRGQWRGHHLPLKVSWQWEEWAFLGGKAGGTRRRECERGVDPVTMVHSGQCPCFWKSPCPLSLLKHTPPKQVIYIGNSLVA